VTSSARLPLTLAALLVPLAAAAQPSSSAPRARSFEVFAGAAAVGPVDFGSSVASLVANQSAGPESTLFRASTTLGTGTGLDGRVAFNITRSLAVEGGMVWTRSTLEAEITSDVENIPNVTLSQDLDTYFFEASAVWHLRPLSFARGRGLPFVSGGAGYLRQLDEDAVMTSDSGRVYHVGGGVKYAFMERRRGLVRGLGVRADARAYVREGGVEFEEGTTRRTTWGLAGGLMVRF
jgi:hypothetical protein